MYQPASGYPQKDGYPSQPPPGYPPQQPGYPPQQHGFPPEQPGYPPQQPGYPPQQPGYPPQQPGYPPQQAGYPSGVGFAPSAPLHGGYPPAGEEPKYDAEGGVAPEFAGSSFSDKNIRRVFIRKVYLILCAQLLVTVGFIAVFIFVRPVKLFVQANIWLYYVSYGVFLVMYITLVCCGNVRRSFPANFICLALFTLAMSYMTGTISSVYDTQIVLYAMGITCAVTLSVTIFSLQTRFDFTKWGGMLFVAVMVLFVFGIIAIILRSQILTLVYAALIALVFTAQSQLTRSASNLAGIWA